MDSKDFSIKGDQFINFLSSRHSKRSFHPDIEISDDIIKKVLSSAAEGTPSTQNTQPWGVTVVKGKHLHSLRDLLLYKYDHNDFGEAEYENRPSNPSLEDFDEKTQQYGKELFEFKGIDRNNEEQRKLHRRENFTFFNAPLLLLIHIPDRAVSGTFLDIGAFIQSISLGFLSYGIGSCPQYSLTSYSDTFRNYYNENGDPLLPSKRILACGMSIGYPVLEDKINSFIPSRQPFEKWAKWF